MPTVQVMDMTGKKLEDLELNEAVFGVAPNEAVMHAVVVNYLANQRQGTQSTLTRTEVRGGGKKPWRQKGTTPDRAPSGLPNGLTAASLWDPNPEATATP